MNAPFLSRTRDGIGPPTLQEVKTEAKDRLARAAELLAGDGLPAPALDGKALRPLAGFAIVPPELRSRLDHRFWWGALAVEMVHEASLLHDDILDDAPQRRGKPTLAASAGVGPALVLGDHLLTSAYRVAASTDSPVFLDLFIRGVERTVAGEIAQEKRQGDVLSPEEYRETITSKSGELFRAVFALAPALLGVGDPHRVGEVGARLGRLYQMVDDYLDYCPSAQRGKPPLQDYHQQKWTWPLELVEARGFTADEESIHRELFSRPDSGGPSPMERGLDVMDGEIRSLLADLEGEGMEPALLGEMLQGWRDQMAGAAERERSLLASPLAGSLRVNPEIEGDTHPRYGVPARAREAVQAAASDLTSPEDWKRYFGKHARSFRFASRLFPAHELEKVAGVYAYCRFTDDLVDNAGGEAPKWVEAKLDAWLEMSREAYQDGNSGVPLLDGVVGGARASGVPFHYLEDLVEGVRMDLTSRSYPTLEALRVYSYRVASVVGGWITELAGIRDPWVLDRAYALGHAMQLTNILRDVGEDLGRGRLYLPLDRMARHGVDQELLEAKASRGGTMFPGYRALLEELMTEAEEEYARAFEAIPFLPPFLRGPVAVAARVYQGIHDEIRKNDYDNLNRRAHTSFSRKVLLAARALWDLRRTVKRAGDVPSAEDPSRRALRGRRGEAVA